MMKFERGPLDRGLKLRCGVFTRTSLRYVRVFAVEILLSVCRLSVCNVRAPAQSVEIFGNVSTAFGSQAIR